MKKYIIYIICIIIVIGFVCYKDFKINNYKKQIIELTEEIKKYKQAANPSKEEIDSLSYNIQYRDSIICDIKTKYIKDVEIIKNMPDSNAVNLFKELVWAD